MPGRSDRATTKIFVGNLPDRYPDDSLRELFEQYGEVSECDVIKNFAFVHFISEEEAESAVKGLNGAEVKGKNIRVEISEKVRRSFVSRAVSFVRLVGLLVRSFVSSRKCSVPITECQYKR